MGERILDRMNRLYKEYQAEKRIMVEPQSAVATSAVTILPKSSPNRENIESLASPDELRRARTHRLIQVGAICDQYMGTSGMTPDKVITLLSRISELDDVKSLIG